MCRQNYKLWKNVFPLCQTYKPTTIYNSCVYKWIASTTLVMVSSNLIEEALFTKQSLKN